MRGSDRYKGLAPNGLSGHSEYVSHSTALYVAIFSTAALAVGWHGAKAWISHGDAQSFRRRIPLATRSRNHNGGVAIFVALVVLFAIYRFVQAHR